jgi:hypothetical protein
MVAFSGIMFVAGFTKIRSWFKRYLTADWYRNSLFSYIWKPVYAINMFQKELKLLNNFILYVVT